MASGSLHPPIRVCHLVSGDAWGGAEAQVHLLLSGLRKDPRFSVSAVLFNQGLLADRLCAARIPIRIIPERTTSFGQQFRMVRRFLQERGIHIVHSHRYKENLLAGLVAPATRNCRVRTQHGLPEPRRGRAWVRQKFLVGLDRLTLRATAHAAIGVCEEVSTWLRQGILSRMGPAVITIHNATDLGHDPLERQQARRRLGLPSDLRVVGAVGRLVPAKGLEVLVTALPDLPGDIHVALVGDGPEENRLRALAYERRVADRVHFLGHHPDAPLLLRAFDALALPSRQEGMPTVVLEALHARVPIVASRVGGVKEILQDGVTALLVEPGDSRALADRLGRVLASPALAGSMSDAGRRSRWGQRGTEALAAEVGDLYERLLAGGADPVLEQT